MEEKQRGEGVEREMVQLWGNKTTQRHLTCGGTGGGVGVKAAGAAHSGIVIRGRGGGMQLIRLREMDHSFKSSPWEALTQNTPVAARLSSGIQKEVF